MKDTLKRIDTDRSLRWRLITAGVLVVVAVILIAVVGRSDQEPLTVAAVTSEEWQRGELGGFVAMEVPERLSAFFLTPEQLPGLVASQPLEAGVFLSSSLLRPQNAAELDDNAPPRTTKVSLEVDTGLWPKPGPFPGDWAVISGSFGGCGLAVLELLEAESETINVRVTPELAQRLSEAGQLTAWPPAAEGWPLCQ